MLTREQLVTLERRLRGTWTLSVYLDGTMRDYAERGAWRVKLDNSLASIRLSLHDAPHAEREAFAQACAHVHAQLARHSGALRSTGWMAYVTAEGIEHVEGLPVVMPTAVTWERGIRIAPYLRAMELYRPVVVAIVDHRQARLWRWRAEALEHVDTIRAHAVVGPFDHMGDAPPQGFHGGVRGSTGTDASQRTLREGLRRMITETAERITSLAGAEAWVVIGGTPHPSLALRQQLMRADALRERVITSRLHVRSSDAEIARTAAEKSRELRGNRDLAVIDDLLEGTSRGRFASTGLAATRRALRSRAVRELLVSDRFVDESSSVSERLVRSALEQGAEVEEVTGAAAERLDATCGGVAGRLRFEPAAI